MRRISAVLAVLVGTLTMGLVTGPPTVAGATTPTTTIYDSTNPSASTLPSLAYEATQATEIGNQVHFAPGTSRTLSSVTITMDSWGCGTSGSWSGGNCVTTPGATFAQPITLNLYQANPDNSVGSLISSVTQTVNLKYRPSSDIVNCTGANAGKWFDGTTCYNGIATDATINLGDITVPDKVVYGVEIRTSNYGDPAIGGPLGSSNPCNAASTGCPYDALNVGLSDDPTNVTVGSNVVTNGIYWNTGYAPNYCDSGSSAVGTFRLDAGCWGESSPSTSAPFYVPAVQFNAVPTCTTTCFVSPTGNDTNAGTSDSPFATIQHAVTTVASGGTVHVAAGTYNENVSINKPVILDGAQSGVDARTRSGSESIISGSGGVVYTAGATTGTIDGFTLEGYTGSTSEIKASDVGSGWNFSNDIIDVSNGGIYLDTNGVSNPTTTTISRDSFVQATPSSASSGYFGGAVNMWSQASNAADNVTVSDNNFTNLSGPTGAVHTGSNPSCTSTGPATDPTHYAKNLTVTGNTFTDTSNDENFVVAFCTSGANITHNTVTVNDPGDTANASTGIYLGGGNYNMTISSNTLSGTGLPAAAISDNSIFNPGGTGDVISGNTITGWTKGVQVAGGLSPAPSNFSVTNNTVSGASMYGLEVLAYQGAMPGGGTVSGNHASGSGTDDCYDNTTGTGTVGTANSWTGNTGDTSSPSGLCQMSTAYVSPTGSDANAGTVSSPFATIQHAVNTVISGGTVHVAAGTYNENVHVTKPVTLDGANVGTPATGARGPESVISTSNAGSSQDLTVQVSSPNVTVDGFTIQQTAPTTCSYCAAFGVQVDPSASGATIADNIISGMSTTQTAPTKGGNPIGVDVSGNGSGTPNNVTVARNLIENISSTGTQHQSAIGIEIGDSTVSTVGTGLHVTSNRITNVTSAAWGGYGIILNRPTTGSQIVGNSIDTIHGGGWTHAIGLEGNTASATIANNAISAISAGSSDSADIFTDTTNNVGVTTETVVDNSLGGGTSGGIASTSTGTLTAANNYWGCPTGPNTTGCSATGGSGPLSLSPWISSFTPDPAHAGQPGFWPISIVVGSNTSTITSAPSVQTAAGKTFQFTMTTHGNPVATVSASGLPAWVTFTPGKGAKAGTAKLKGKGPVGGGDFTFTLHATNGVGPDTTQTFTVHVLAITSAPSASFSKSGPPTQSFTVTTTGVGSGVTLTATPSGVLSGLTFHDNGDGTATLSGTPAATDRTHVLKITATSGASVTIQKLAVSISA